MRQDPARRDDAEHWVKLGFSALQGQGQARNFARAREYFGNAAELGHSRAREIHLSMVASGFGGVPNFKQGVRLLERLGDSFARRQLALLHAMRIDARGNPIAAAERSEISATPEISFFPAFLSSEECRYLIEAASPAFARAPVQHLAGGSRTMVHPVRTCDVAVFPWVAETPVIHALNRRIANAANVPVECGEPLQVLRYRTGQEFQPHQDCTDDRSNQRVLTMLIYLSEDYSGGETFFPRPGLKVRGRVGDAVLFRNAALDGTPDPNALHAGLPVLSGEKFIASRWIRKRAFGPREY